MKREKLIFISIALAVACQSSADDSRRSEDRLQVNRYSTISITPSAAQRDLLSVVVDIQFPGEIKLVGEAIRHLLMRSGYRLNLSENKLAQAQYYLMSLPLPEVHRQLGPISILRALDVLGGGAFDVDIDPVKRKLFYRLTAEFTKTLSGEDILFAKQIWQKRI